ncbi:MAG: GTPase HflX [Candidatus Sericytochromatia bacterium]|nr:MAG: GTPase HflX [Candidatus Sericytochromatia bacterium]
MIETNKPTEKAFIVAVKLNENSEDDIKESLNELKSLLDTAGAKVIKSFIQNRSSIDPAFYIGIGKVEEIKKEAKENNIDTIVFDTELSPRQIRNLEKEIGKKILDRSWVILDIFALRAKTREAKTQVELAQLKYFMPRLTRQWTHLSRQVGGGVGTKGPGETQLETDKRLIKTRIAFLEKELKEIEKQRIVQRKSREDEFKAVLVGYTNVGKSTLLNKLSNANVLAENRLFATLDSTTRIVELKNKKYFLLSDTVGFIRKLPHHLVASFKSTLEEIKYADLILHVIDVSHSHFREQIKTVEQVLADLKVLNKRTIYVFNKVDMLPKEDLEIINLEHFKSDKIFISAEKNINIDKLKDKILKIIEEDFRIKEFKVPIENSKLLSFIYQNSEVIREDYDDSHIKILIKAKTPNMEKIESNFK